MSIKFAVEETIHAAPHAVFSVLTDIDNAKRWTPNCVGVERLTPGRFAVGTRWRETRKMYGGEATEEFEVTRCDPPRRIELFVDGRKGSSKRGEYRFVYKLAPVEEGTRVTLRGSVSTPGWLWKLVGKMFVGSFKKACVKDLQTMRAYIEARAFEDTRIPA